MANKIIHKHSSVVTDGQAKLPTIDQLDYGELAVNYADGVETISMKNSENEIVEFKSKEYFEEIIKENEVITAAALTELNEKLKEYEWEGEKSLAETITDLEQVVEDNGLITSAALNTLNKRVTAIEESGSGAIAEKLANIEKDIEDNEYVVATALSDLDVRIDENELITASALTQLNEKIKSLEEGNVGGLEDRLVSIETMVENNSLVAATALTNLDERTASTERKIVSLTSIDAKIDKRITAIDELITANEESNKEDKLVITTALTDLNERVNNVDNLASNKNQSLVDSVESYVVDTPKVLISLKKYNEITPEELNLKEGDTLTLDCTTNHVEAPSYAYPFHINLGGKHVICKISDGEYMTKYNYGALTGHHTFMYANNCFILVSDDIEGYTQINHGTNDTSFALTPNRFHVWGTVPTLNLSLKTPTPGVANEYVFQFTSIEEGTDLSLPYNVQWVNDTPPTITGGMTYQISIVNGLATAFEYAKKEPNPNEIWYTTFNGLTMEPYFEEVNIISNTYENGMGVLTFDADITKIEGWSFEESYITSITIPNSVTSIGNNAFYYCENLTSITIPDSVTEIGVNAFSGCFSLATVNLGHNIISIKNKAFYECESLASITIPDSVTEIDERAFEKCKNLTSVYCQPTTPPAGSPDMFNSNASGRKIYVPIASVDAYKTATYWSDYADVIETSSLNNVIYYTTSDSIIATPYCTSVFGANIISNTYENGVGIITFDADVTSIGEWAFYHCYELTSVTIPNSVTEIGKWAFGGCDSLTSVTIPDSVIEIAANAFSFCYTLTSITIPDSVTSIGERAFFYCYELTEITIPDSVTSIGDEAFSDCSALTSVNLGNGVTSIGESAFYGCNSLTSITIPDSVTSIGSDVFRSCSKLAEFNSKYATEDKRCIIIDNKLIAFAPAGLTSYVIPDGVISIDNWTFSDCKSLTSVTIPNSVTEIGDWAFSSCKSLTSVTIPDSVTSIGNNAFSSCKSLASLDLGSGVTEIGNEAFYGCNSLTSITIPDSVTTIGVETFRGCSNLASVNLGNGVTSIGNLAFRGCTSLTEFNGILASEDKRCIVIDGKLSAFAPGSNITTYTIPEGVTSIGNSAFYYCDMLTSITIPDSVTSIGDEAFDSCKSLTEITIPDSVTTIGNLAFRGCTSLTSVYCQPTTPPAGDSDMFYYNASGRKIYVPMASVDAYKTAKYWSDYADNIEGYNF